MKNVGLPFENLVQPNTRHIFGKIIQRVSS